MLRDFAQRKGITYPMLSDPESKVIRAFGILNTNIQSGTAFYGIPFPGTYVIDERGLVRSKYFEEDHRERYTAANILTRSTGAGGMDVTTVETPHLKLSYSASDATLTPGGRTALILELEIKPGMHVYAPGVSESYIPVSWEMGESRGWMAEPAVFPPGRRMRLDVINETVPVYEGRARFVRDLKIGQQQALGPLIGQERVLTVEGTFRYQACDAKECYPPRTIPLKWSFHIERLDSQRAPAELQRK